MEITGECFPRSKSSEVIQSEMRSRAKCILWRQRITTAVPAVYYRLISRESRWFTPWCHRKFIEDYTLPPMVARITDQSKVPFGDALLETRDSVVGFEICEELHTPDR